MRLVSTGRLWRRAPAAGRGPWIDEPGLAGSTPAGGVILGGKSRVPESFGGTRFVKGRLFGAAFFLPAASDQHEAIPVDHLVGSMG
jgi:hypothetical protein